MDFFLGLALNIAAALVMPFPASAQQQPAPVTSPGDADQALANEQARTVRRPDYSTRTLGK